MTVSVENNGTHPKGTEFACPACGRRYVLALPSLTVLCRGPANRPPHKMTVMRPVETTTSV